MKHLDGRPLSNKRGYWMAAALAASAVLLAGLAPAREPVKPTARPDGTAVDAAALNRAREEVKLMDDLYKLWIVNVTATYVKARERTPAATVAKRVFAELAKSGRTTRLLDATGEPINKDNVAKTAFEKKAIAELRKGKTTYEEVGEVKGKPVLRVATAIPVVLGSCINCHPGLKEGQLIGALAYELPIK
jgi:hypothetical protein